MLEIPSGPYDFSSFKTSEEISFSEKDSIPEDLVLGKQAEACFELYLKKCDRYKIKLANVQIQGEKETLGELDYIVFDKTLKKTIHIELACKFYLFDEKASTIPEAKWIGPNRKDTLFDKLEKLKNRQLPLIYKLQTQQILRDVDIEVTSVIQQICLKAFLFIPQKIDKNNFPENFQKCIAGYWIPLSVFSTENKEAVYAIPTKKDWLLPPEKSTEWHTFPEAKKIITENCENKKAPLVYKKHKGTLERFFVVWW